uniref:Nucleolar protein 4-like b n=1 Tax=Oryzias latipes TaxID=8090 RepID=A0A3B3HIW9_ORYLA
MHVEIGTEPGKTPKHAGQKKTYKAIAEMYAFLPREAVTRFLMTCGECQKRMHLAAAGQDCKENDIPNSLASEEVDYNLPLTTTYMKMKQQLISFLFTSESRIECGILSMGGLLSLLVLAFLLPSLDQRLQNSY